MTPPAFLLESGVVTADPIRLRLENVGKTYGSRPILRSIFADLQSGDTLAVTGRNGAGKSTLLRIIAGLLRPSQGTVSLLVDGMPVGTDGRRQVLGFVGADVHLYRELSAREHLSLVARLRGLPGGLAAGLQLFRAMGLAGREDERVGGYSSGMLQRLRYVLALVHQPRLLLLDDPTTNLDTAGIALVDGIVERAARTGIVIVATNDPRDLRYAELVLSLDTREDR